MKKKLDGLEVNIIHVSGICSNLDWVRAAQESGFKFVSGITGYCAKSLSPIPAEYADLKSCKTPAECHQSIPNDPEDRINPWHMDSGKNWLTPADSGVVALPGDGVLACREEVENRSSDVIKCDLSQKDIDLSLEDIKESLKLTDPNKAMFRQDYYQSSRLNNKH